MKCRLCQAKEADKKNTHYLTDAVIRTCLNQDGSNKREKGFYFGVSNNSEYGKLNIQRETSPEKIEKFLGHSITDEEIENDTRNRFSADNIFCSQCESLFASIENYFNSKILYRCFRNNDLSKKEEMEIEESKLKNFRLFFYLQLWRSHICDSNFKLREDIVEDLGQIILNHDIIKLSEITKYPLAITYLETLGGDKEYTKNLVGCVSGENPYVIIMNDFIIQFYNSDANICYCDLCGINNPKSFRKYINQNETTFQVQIIHNNYRETIIGNYVKEEFSFLF